MRLRPGHRRAPVRMLTGLRRRLLVMLLAPLVLLALVNAWFDYRSADNVALQQDQRLAGAGAAGGRLGHRAKARGPAARRSSCSRPRSSSS
jgi:O-antigen ligase